MPTTNPSHTAASAAAAPGPAVDAAAPVDQHRRTLNSLVALAGFDAVALLLEWRGGTRYTVPTSLAQADDLVERVGLDAARALVRELAGVRLDLPSRLHLRTAQALALRAEGKPYAEIALATGLTERWVRELCKRGPQAMPHRQAPPDDGQLGLFADLAAPAPAPTPAPAVATAGGAHDPFGLARRPAAAADDEAS